MAITPNLDNEAKQRKRTNGAVAIETKPDDEILHLLTHNMVGTPGKSMVYQHQKVEEKLYHIPEPNIITIRWGHRVLGTCFCCKRTTWNRGEAIESFYVRFFSFRDSFRLKGKPVARTRESGLRAVVHEIFSGHQLTTNPRHLFYAHVDPENERSVRMTREYGFSKVGSFRTLLFGRLFPKAHRNVSKIPREEIEETIDRHHKSYCLVSKENLFYKGNYFVIKKEGRIVAGAQAFSEHWKIHDMPHWSGKIMMKVLPRIPVLNRLFHPDFRFLSVEGLFCEAGHEWELEALLTDLLYRFGVNTAVLCLDPVSGIYRQVKQLRMGIANKFNKEKEMDVIVRANGFSVSDITTPTYVSGFDVM